MAVPATLPALHERLVARPAGSRQPKWEMSREPTSDVALDPR
jgi:hypothetical protein